MEAGIFDQGLWSYKNFSEYREKWIIPNMLGDLETIFEGADNRWAEKKKADKNLEDGRGDFILATALLAIFDHLGMFLAKSRKSSLQTIQNIARTAQHIDSVKDANFILGYLGRHALTHGAWPQTFKFLPDEWAFGLNIFAEEPKKQTRLYVKKYGLNTNKTFNVVKLRIYIKTLRRELDFAVKNNPAFSNVNPLVFKRVRQEAIDSAQLGQYNYGRKEGDEDEFPNAYKRFEEQMNFFVDIAKSDKYKEAIKNLQIKERIELD